MGKASRLSHLQQPCIFLFLLPKEMIRGNERPHPEPPAAAAYFWSQPNELQPSLHPICSLLDITQWAEIHVHVGYISLTMVSLGPVAQSPLAVDHNWALLPCVCRRQRGTTPRVLRR